MLLSPHLILSSPPCYFKMMNETIFNLHLFLFVLSFCYRIPDSQPSTCLVFFSCCDFFFLAAAACFCPDPRPPLHHYNRSPILSSLSELPLSSPLLWLMLRNIFSPGPLYLTFCLLQLRENPHLCPILSFGRENLFSCGFQENLCGPINGKIILWFGILTLCWTQKHLCGGSNSTLFGPSAVLLLWIWIILSVPKWHHSYSMTESSYGFMIVYFLLYDYFSRQYEISKHFPSID